MPAQQLDPAAIEDRVRRICLALPGAEERTSHGSPAFFVGRQFVMLWPDGHHDNQFPHLWCAAPPGAQEELTSTEPDRFFRHDNLPFSDTTDIRDNWRTPRTGLWF